MFLLIRDIAYALIKYYDFNTSHVSINPFGVKNGRKIIVFQYISCFY